MTDQPTPTPRTDLHSVHWVQHGGSQSIEVVPAYFARDLECEISAERALADRLASVMFGCAARDMNDAYEAWEAARNEAVNPP